MVWSCPPLCGNYFPPISLVLLARLLRRIWILWLHEAEQAALFGLCLRFPDPKAFDPLLQSETLALSRYTLLILTPNTGTVLMKQSFAELTGAAVESNRVCVRLATLESLCPRFSHDSLDVGGRTWFWLKKVARVLILLDQSCQSIILNERLAFGLGQITGPHCMLESLLNSDVYGTVASIEVLTKDLGRELRWVKQVFEVQRHEVSFGGC